GRDYRVLVIDKKVAAVALRMTPCVFGDGIHTIGELIEIENKSPLRGFDHEKPLTKIKVDNIVLNYLKNNNMSLNYIPKLHEKVILRFNANLSTGGVAKDCTDIIHPDNMEAAIKSAEAVGLDVAGVDICTGDISKSIYEDKGVVLEVNAAPGIRMHLYPSLGRGRNVASSIVDYIFKDKKDYSIPVVSITG
ncbi:MAG TPA: cyanophycin synthetase, partial [Clostridiaceae bacterium]|nr:cyanophycin synthetase [Clostridiaceae bacterium]